MASNQWNSPLISTFLRLKKAHFIDEAHEPVMNYFFLQLIFLIALEERDILKNALDTWKTTLSRHVKHDFDSLNATLLDSLDMMNSTNYQLRLLFSNIFSPFLAREHISSTARAVETTIVLDLMSRASDTLENMKKECSDRLITDESLKIFLQALLSEESKKKSGAYYTPEEITHFIVQKSLESWLLARINDHFTLSLTSLTQLQHDVPTDVVLHALKILEGIKILEPAIGAGDFLVAILEVLSSIMLESLQAHPECMDAFVNGLDESAKELLNRSKSRKDGNVAVTKNALTAIIKTTLCSSMYGVDINPMAVVASKIRIFLNIIDELPSSCQKDFLPWMESHLRLNFIMGDALLGFLTLDDFLSAMNDLVTARKSHGVIVPEINEALKAMYQLLKKEASSISNVTTSSANGIRDLLSAVKQVHDVLRHEKDLVSVMSPLKEALAAYFSLKTRLQEEMFPLQETKQHETLKDLLSRMDFHVSNFVDACWNATFNTKNNDQNHPSRPVHWFLAFPDIFFLHGGFDVVIGNPPYLVEVRDNKNVFRRIKHSPLGKKYYEQKMDVFYFFMFQGIDMLTPKGVLGFIIPEYWINRRFARKLRHKIFTETTPLFLVFFGEHPVFPHAPGHHDMIVILQKKPDVATEHHQKTIIWRHACKVTECTKHAQLSWLLDDRVRNSRVTEFSIPTGQLYDPHADVMHVSAPHRANAFRLLSQHAWYLDTAEIQLGLTAPQNEVTSRALKKFSNPPWNVGEGIFALRIPELKQHSWTTEEIELFRFFFTARDVGAFEHAMTITRLLIYTDQNNLQRLKQHPQQYEHVISHLKRFQPLITSDHGPHGLHRARQPVWFEDPLKIVGVRKTTHPRFVVVPVPFYVDLSCLIIRLKKSRPVSPYFVAGMLNSSAGKDILHYLKHQGKQLQVDKSVLVKFPFPLPNRDDFHHLISWLSLALHCMKTARHYQEVEDHAVDQLWQLLEESVDHLVNQQFLPRRLNQVAKHAPKLAYPSWLIVPTIKEVLSTTASECTIKIKKDLMERDVASIMSYLEALLEH